MLFHILLFNLKNKNKEKKNIINNMLISLNGYSTGLVLINLIIIIVIINIDNINLYKELKL